MTAMRLLLAVAVTILLSALAHAQQSGKAVEARCGDEPYRGIADRNHHGRFYCVDAFLRYCQLKTLEDPGYRESYPNVSAEQLQKAIRQARGAIDINCSSLEGLGARAACPYCGPPGQRATPNRAPDSAGTEDRKPAQEAAPAPRRMYARTGTNIRSGPGTTYRKVGFLQAGQEVRVTGEADGWFKIEKPGGGIGFVHGSLLTGSAQQARAAAGPSPKCAGMGKGAKCWLEVSNKPGCYVFDFHYNPPVTVTWSGACSGGVAVGRGTLGWRSNGSGEATGTLVRGKRHGRWVLHNADGYVHEGSYVNGMRHGRWVVRLSNGRCWAGHFRHGKLQGAVTDC